MPDAPGLGTPLDDVLVADFTRLLPGGYATQILADLGARVVKLEAPFGGLHHVYWRALGSEGVWKALGKRLSTLTIGP